MKLVFQEADFIRFMLDPENPSANTPDIPEKDDWGNFPKASNVLHLTDENFAASVSSKDPTLVMFYAPCEYYKSSINTVFLIF